MCACVFVCASVCVCVGLCVSLIHTDFENVVDGGFASLDQLLEEVMLVSGGVPLTSTDVVALYHIRHLLYGEHKVGWA